MEYYCMICHQVHNGDGLPGVIFATGYFYDRPSGRTFHSGICTAKRLPEPKSDCGPGPSPDTSAEQPHFPS